MKKKILKKPRDFEPFCYLMISTYLCVKRTYVCKQKDAAFKSLSSNQTFFSFDDFTWSKKLLDRLTFLKQTFCLKKPKVPRH